MAIAQSTFDIDPMWHGLKIGDWATLFAGAATFAAVCVAIGVPFVQGFLRHLKQKRQERRIAQILAIEMNVTFNGLLSQILYRRQLIQHALTGALNGNAAFFANNAKLWTIDELPSGGDLQGLPYPIAPSIASLRANIMMYNGLVERALGLIEQRVLDESIRKLKIARMLEVAQSALARAAGYLSEYEPSYAYVNYLDNGNGSNLDPLPDYKRRNAMKRLKVDHMKEFTFKNLGPGIIWLGLGIVVGIIFRLPIFPWVLPPSLTPVASSLAGALIGAGAAGFWAQRALTRGDREACRTVAKAFRVTTIEASELQDILKGKNVEFKKFVDQLDKLDKSVKHSERRLAMLSTLHSQMKEGKGVAIADAQIGLEELSKALTDIRKATDDEIARIQSVDAITQTHTNIPSSRNWNDGLDQSLDKSLNILRSAMRELGHALDNVRDFYPQNES